MTDPALLPSSSSRNARLRADEELICIMTKAVNELGLEWSPLRSHLASHVFSRGAIKPPANARPPSFPKFIRAHDIMARPHSSRIRPSASVALTSVDCAEEKGYEHLPLSGKRNRPGSTRHQSHRPSIWRSMSSLIVLKRLLWLTITEMKEAGKVPFLHAPVSSSSLFGPAVERFAECFTEAQKSSQLQHFLPKRISSSSASRRSRPAPIQQTAKPPPTVPEPQTPEGRRDGGHSRSARRYPFPKRQGPWPKIALDSQAERGGARVSLLLDHPASSLYCASRCLVLGAEESVFMDPHGPTIAPRCPTGRYFDSGQNKTHFQKESKNLFLPTISVLPLCSQSAQLFQPLAMRAEDWHAIPGVSTWVMTMVRRGYTPQFAQRPPRFRDVLATTVRSENAQVLRAEVVNMLVKEP